MAKKKKTSRKRRVLGALGKAGVVVMAVPPIVGSAISAFKKATVRTPGNPDSDPTIASRIDMFWRGWLNGITKGFSLNEPFKTVRVDRVGGGDVTLNIQAEDIPSGVWWTTLTAGGLMLAVDRISGWALKRPVKMPGTNFTLTGN